MPRPVAVSVPLENHLNSSRVAKILGVRTNTLAKWRCAGKGPHGWFRAGPRLVLYPESAVCEFLAELKQGTGR